MAEISKISKVAIADVAKVDAVTKANIADINGLTIPSGVFTGLLDTYTGAAVAYSVRRLASATSVLIRVRRDTGGGTGDDDEADVAYDSNDELSLDSAISNTSFGVTATTLGQFINVGTVGGTTYTNPDSLTGTASCYVDEWKDQSGNANDAPQTGAIAQPQIHDGTVNTDLITENGKPALSFDGGDTFTTSSVTIDVDDVAYVAVGAIGTIQNGMMVKLGPASNRFYAPQIDSGNVGVRWGSPAMVSFGTADTNQHLYSVYGTPSADTAYQDGSAVTLSSRTATYSSAITIGGFNSNQPSYIGTTQEIILWTTDQSDNRTAIETNIDDHYQIPAM